MSDEPKLDRCYVCSRAYSLERPRRLARHQQEVCAVCLWRVERGLPCD